MNTDLSPPRTVAFTGYRPEKMPFPEDPAGEDYRRFRATEAKVIRRLFDLGYTRFVSGMARGFDLWVAEDVLALRARHPAIQLVCAIPFSGQSNGWAYDDRARWQAVREAADEVVILSDTVRRDAFFARNRYMVDMADVVVCAFDGKPGGTKYTVDYAAKAGKALILLSPATCAVTVQGEIGSNGL